MRPKRCSLSGYAVLAASAADPLVCNCSACVVLNFSGYFALLCSNTPALDSLDCDQCGHSRRSARPPFCLSECCTSRRGTRECGRFPVCPHHRHSPLTPSKSFSRDCTRKPMKKLTPRISFWNSLPLE